MPRVLIVDDDPGFRLGLADALGREGFTTTAAATREEARRELARSGFDVLFVDLNLPDGSGLDLLTATEAESIVLTGQASVEVAAEALRRGARDCLAKPVDLVRLRMTLAGLSRAREQADEIARLRSELRALGRFGYLVGSSLAMQAVFDRLSAASRTDTPVLLTGEAGTGKELAARTLHRLDHRGAAAFVPLSSGPALSDRSLLDRARGGTLFVAELLELAEERRAVLLRALSASGVRVIAATRHDPDRVVSAKSRWADLLRDLAAFRIALPPLRERSGDVELLSERFLGLLNLRAGTSKRLTRAALERLRTYPWPGNVPELRHVLRRAFPAARDDIDAAALALRTPGRR